jgi:phosphate transport system substrate-binding protein
MFGYSYLEENIDRLHGTPIEGVSPTSYATSSPASYPGARPLFIYVKKRHQARVPRAAGLPRTLYTTMWKPKGELTKRGLIAAPDAQRRHSAQIMAQRDSRSIPPSCTERGHHLPFL